MTFAASAAGPALLNGQPIQTSGRNDPDGATVLTARANLAPEHWAAPMPQLKREFRSSIAYRLCLVAQGRFDVVLTLRPSWEWDIAAGDLIARRAGASVTDRLGTRLAYNARHPQTQGLLAAPPGLHRTLLSQLRMP